MINNKTKEDFVREVLGDINLDYIVEWIRNSLSPDDVFDTKALEDWAYYNGYVNVSDNPPEKVYDVGDLKEWALISGLEPEELCGVSDLERWAETNDFIRFY